MGFSTDGDKASLNLICGAYDKGLYFRPAKQIPGGRQIGSERGQS